MSYLLNLVQSPVDERDWVAEQIYSARSVATSIKLPQTFTLVPQLPPVRDQGPYGTCAAQVASCMKEWQERKDVKFTSYMSPQFVYDNRINSSTSGMYARDVMSILKNKGICPESMYPYANTTRQLTESVISTAKQYVIKSYASITTINGLKTALVTSGPCFIAFPVYNTGKTFWKNGRTLLGGHAVTVVGYDRTGFILRNSWGSKWGNRGYTTYPYSDWGRHWEIWTTIDEHTVYNNATPVKSTTTTATSNSSIPAIKATDPEITPVVVPKKHAIVPSSTKNMKIFRNISQIKRSN